METHAAAEISKHKIVSTLIPQDDDEDEEIQELMQTLPKGKGWLASDEQYCFYQGFWCPCHLLKAVISFQQHFQALDTDIIVASSPKCGTTWLKALSFSIVNRHHFAKQEEEDNHLLSRFNSHQLVQFFEIEIYEENPFPDLSSFCPFQPRMFATHLPYASLAPSIKDSMSKIVYICRNPMDTFISLWHFSSKLRRVNNMETLSLDEAFDMFCQGIHGFGPFFDHVLGYWKASQENTNKILFLKYEDVKDDVVSHVKKIGEFLGFPFSEEEEKQGMVEEIANMCSFGKLKELDVNKNGQNSFGAPFNSLFRKAEVGDWKNYLTPFMVERFEKLMHENLDKFGLEFKLG